LHGCNVESTLNTLLHTPVDNALSSHQHLLVTFVVVHNGIIVFLEHTLGEIDKLLPHIHGPCIGSESAHIGKLFVKLHISDLAGNILFPHEQS